MGHPGERCDAWHSVEINGQTCLARGLGTLDWHCPKDAQVQQCLVPLMNPNPLFLQRSTRRFVADPQRAPQCTISRRSSSSSRSSAPQLPPNAGGGGTGASVGEEGGDTGGDESHSSGIRTTPSARSGKREPSSRWAPDWLRVMWLGRAERVVGVAVMRRWRFCTVLGILKCSQIQSTTLPTDHRRGMNIFWCFIPRHCGKYTANSTRSSMWTFLGPTFEVPAPLYSDCSSPRSARRVLGSGSLSFSTGTGQACSSGSRCFTQKCCLHMEQPSRTGWVSVQPFTAQGRLLGTVADRVQPPAMWASTAALTSCPGFWGTGAEHSGQTGMLRSTAFAQSCLEQRRCSSQNRFEHLSQVKSM
mmetsp:Transcript_79232/g.132310  ORF Transcript_79232/g.132310 Transcript_79232/m.132310 type:complete len:359 (+) Transcript_79232:1555-2631(+)